MDMPASGILTGLKLLWEVLRAVTSRNTNNPLRDPRVRRWHEVTKAHGLDPLTTFTRLGVDDVPVTVAFDNKVLADRLSPAVLRQTAEYFNVRQDWILGCDELRYDTMVLDRSFRPVARDLLDWQSIGSGHSILVFKSRRVTLEKDPWQRGALVAMREMVGSDEHLTYAYRPIYTLRSWCEPEQRWCAFRAIWAAWYLGFNVHGYDASEHQCDGLREGKLFPGTLQLTWGAGTWHPDDYVVRPSARAKGNDDMVEAMERDHADELQALAADAGCDMRRWGKFSRAAGS
jgi:hypothetical protein